MACSRESKGKPNGPSNTGLTLTRERSVLVSSCCIFGETGPFGGVCEDLKQEGNSVGKLLEVEVQPVLTEFPSRRPPVGGFREHKQKTTELRACVWVTASSPPNCLCN